MPTYLIILIALYAVPIARIGLFFFPPISLRPLLWASAIFGRYEWIVRFPRDSIIFLILLPLIVLGIYEMELVPTGYYSIFALLSIFSWLRRRLHARKMAEFARLNPSIHPADFFLCYYAGFGIIPVKLSHAFGRRITPADCSFNTGDVPSLKFWPVFVGAFNTYAVSRILVAAFKWKGPQYARDAGRALSIIWGARAVQLGRLSVEAEGLEKLKDLEGKFIFAFSHKSFLDFAVAPLVLASAFNLRHLAARDHFLDNIFLYFLMGRAMRAIGTIFVDRRHKVSSGRVSVTEAVEGIVNAGVDVSIFPQGTRAHKTFGPQGERMDAGYYTSGSAERLKKDGGHLKKGAAYIAANAMMHLRRLERSAVNIVPVGIFGTATAIPKGSIRVQTEGSIRVKIGEAITLTKNDVSDIKADSDGYHGFVAALHRRVDDGLKEVLNVHNELEKRFFTDIRRFLPAVDFEYVAVAMKPWRGEDYLIYTILDCIYAVRPRRWHDLLRELCHIMMSDSPRESYVRFKGRVVDLMLEGR